MVRAKAPGQFEFKHKHELKYKTPCKQHEIKLVSTSKDYQTEWEYEPAELNKNGVHASVSLEGSCAPDKNEWAGKAEFKVGGFKVGPLVPFVEVSVCLCQVLSFISIGSIRHQPLQGAQANPL